jgi:SAM-dependent methyltransferase
LYSTDLAYIHDAGFGDFAERAAPELIRILRRHDALGARRVVEVGCGSGTLARRLVDARHNVVGFDISPAMIRLARAKVPEAKFRVASLTEARMPRCDAVVAIGEVMSYVPARAGGNRLPPALLRFFSRVHRALEPGGLFIFDFLESGTRRTCRARIQSGQDWVIAVHAALDKPRQVLTRRIITIRKIGRQYRRTQESHCVRIYSRRAIANALAGAGFATRMSPGFGRCRLLAGDVAVIARKQA